MAKLKCQTCGKGFFRPDGRVRVGRDKYCSRQCAAAARRIPKEAQCLYCHAPFNRRTRTQKYCSVHCANEAARVTAYRAPAAPDGDYTAARPAVAGYALFEDPWANGGIKPDRYGNDYRMPDFGLGF